MCQFLFYFLFTRHLHSFLTSARSPNMLVSSFFPFFVFVLSAKECERKSCDLFSSPAATENVHYFTAGGTAVIIISISLVTVLSICTETDFLHCIHGCLPALSRIHRALILLWRPIFKIQEILFWRMKWGYEEMVQKMWAVLQLITQKSKEKGWRNKYTVNRIANLVKTVQFLQFVASINSVNLDKWQFRQMAKLTLRSFGGHNFIDSMPNPIYLFIFHLSRPKADSRQLTLK